MRRPGIGVSGLVWVVAFSALGIDAISAFPDAAHVAALVVAGHGLTAAAWLWAGRESRPARRGNGLLVAILATFAAIEIVGQGVAIREGQGDLASWFALALSFSAVGLLATSRATPTDGALAAQLFFHPVLAIPALAALIRAASAAIGGPAAARAFGGTAPVARLLLVVVGVVLPILFAALVVQLLYELSRPRGTRDPVWTSILAHQAAFVVIACRWSFDGL